MYSFIYLFKMVNVAIYNIQTPYWLLDNIVLIYYINVYIYTFLFRIYLIHHNTHNLNIKVVKTCTLFKYTIYFLYKTQIAMLLFGWTVYWIFLFNVS